jgi:hypothetical protein
MRSQSMVGGLRSMLALRCRQAAFAERRGDRVIEWEAFMYSLISTGHPDFG